MDRNQAIYDTAEELEAVLLLLNHNKNHLQFGTNPKRLNVEMILLAQRIKSLARDVPQ